MSKTEAEENLGSSLEQAENSRRLKAVSGLGSICWYIHIQCTTVIDKQWGECKNVSMEHGCRYF
jgi:hypothetical protein